MLRKCGNCSRDAIILCNCTNPPLLLCSEHRHHRYSSAIHRESHLYKSISRECAQAAYQTCQQALKDLEAITKSYLQNYQKAIKGLKLEFQEKQKICTEKRLQLIEQIRYLTVYDSVPCNVPLSQTERNITDLLQTFSIQALPAIKAVDLGKLFQDQVQPRTQINTKLLVPIPNMREVFSFDVLTHETKSFSVNCAEFPYMYGFCMLPNNSLVIYGGTRCMIEPKLFLMSNEAALINPGDRSVRILNDFTEKSDMGHGTYFKGEIYTYGGFDKNCKPLVSCQKYNIETNLWKNICELPVSFGYTTSALYTDKICVCGRKSGVVYMYSPQRNSYERTYSAGLSHKILLSTGERVFLIHDDRILMLEEEWLAMKDGGERIDTILLCPYVVKDKFIYFIAGKIKFNDGVVEKSRLYRMHIETCDMELMRNDIVNNSN